MNIKMTKKGNAKDRDTGDEFIAVSPDIVNCNDCAFAEDDFACEAAKCVPVQRAFEPGYTLQGSVIFVRKEKTGA